MSGGVRVLPVVGMQVTVMHLGRQDAVVVEAVRDEGRTVVVASGEVFTLRRLTGNYVLEGEPYYGPRLVFEG